MTKQCTINFENEEFNTVKKAKGDLSWHDFVMILARKRISRIEKGEN